MGELLMWAMSLFATWQVAALLSYRRGFRDAESIWRGHADAIAKTWRDAYLERTKPNDRTS